MGLELYLDLMSPPCRWVYMFAKKNNIPFEHKQMVLAKGEQHSEAFAKVNQLKKVPALKDGDFTLAESTAILVYLAQKYKTADHWYPSDLQKRARVDEFLAWQHTTLTMNNGRLMMMKTMAPMLLGHPVPAEKVDAAVQELNMSLKQMEEKFLQDKTFLTGEEISLADLVAFTTAAQPLGGGPDILDGRPKLIAWRQHVEAEIGEELINEMNQVMEKAKAMLGGPVDPAMKEMMKAYLQKML
ncbi:glutathione S-transferase theta-3-like [Protopterus annectens]|uniref:glutathione S-transferase theta-3-like n=1 Tax=Protopterus annectens TaxID=7888 RepID=UPI001CF9FC2C|nr:glutathione S-transferase theta-3-like [Protopterus annectens]